MVDPRRRGGAWGSVLGETINDQDHGAINPPPDAARAPACPPGPVGAGKRDQGQARLGDGLSRGRPATAGHGGTVSRTAGMIAGQMTLDGCSPSGWMVCKCRALVRAGHACPSCGKRHLTHATAIDLKYVRTFGDDPAVVAVERRGG